MKNKIYFFLLLSILTMLFSACSIPVMKMQHTNFVLQNYQNKVGVKIVKFVDNRLFEEKEKNKKALNTLTPRIFSGNTNPEMAEYFYSILLQEAENTKIFMPVKNGEYVLAGEILSMKVERNVTIARFLVSIFDFPKIKATVIIRAGLFKNGNKIFETVIEEENITHYAAITETTWTAISKKCSKVMDEAITKAVKELFDRIDKELKK